MFYSQFWLIPEIRISFPKLIPNCIFQFFNNGSGDFQKGGDYQRFKGILWYIVAGTRGGPNRARILDLLGTKSLNAHQISKELNLDHKTVAHHLEILSKNELVEKKEDQWYGNPYNLTSIMKDNSQALQEIMSKIKKKS